MFVTETEDRGVVAEDAAVVAGRLELVPLAAVFGLNDDAGGCSRSGTPKDAPPLIGVTFASLKYLVKLSAFKTYFAEMIFPFAVIQFTRKNFFISSE